MPEQPTLDIVDLYNAAAAIEDPLECDAYLGKQCGEDLPLIEKLQGMLQVREEAEQWFEAEPKPPANIILATMADAQQQSGNGKRPTNGATLPFRPMLTDFGVARIVEEGLTQTHSSLLMGTPLYMAPEQAECDRRKIGPTSDIFALGVVLYELLYGARPFDGDSAIQVIDLRR